MAIPTPPGRWRRHCAVTHESQVLPSGHVSEGFFYLPLLSPGGGRRTFHRDSAYPATALPTSILSPVGIGRHLTPALLSPCSASGYHRTRIEMMMDPRKYAFCDIKDVPQISGFIRNGDSLCPSSAFHYRYISLSAVLRSVPHGSVSAISSP